MKATPFLFLFFLLPALAHAQAPDPKWLIGRWEVLEYSEQGLQVNKKQAVLPQALRVYNHVKEQRSLYWYGYTEDDATNTRQRRALERWAERDSIKEVSRIAEAIAMPYYAVFFPDSTLALYNKDTITNTVYFPESHFYVFDAKTMSIDIKAPQSRGYTQWEAQILFLSEDRLTLFLPEDAEIVQLVKRTFSLP